MKTLGTVDICGIEYTVGENSLEEDHLLGDCYAYTMNIKSLIVLRAGLAPSVFRNCIFHEVQHAIWEHSGLKQLTGTAAEHEELFIQIFTPHLITALASMKKWRTK